MIFHDKHDDEFYKYISSSDALFHLQDRIEREVKSSIDKAQKEYMIEYQKQLEKAQKYNKTINEINKSLD